MAFITAETVKEFRNKIKAAFPATDGWKWSVTRDNGMAVNAALMQFPKGYNFPTYESRQLNPYFLEEAYEGKELEVLLKVRDILYSQHWDESDIQSDYFNCAYYVHMDIGKWDKLAVQSSK